MHVNQYTPRNRLAGLVCIQQPSTNIIAQMKATLYNRCLNRGKELLQLTNSCNPSPIAKLYELPLLDHERF